MRAHLLFTIFAFVLGLPIASSIAAEDGRYGPNFEFDPTLVPEWKEAAVASPLYPVDKNLMALPPSARDSVKVYLDETSLSRGPDGVVRFSLIVESARGARNVFYQGIRCETREYKIYAFGTPSGAFKSAKLPAWKPIPTLETNAFQHDLYQNYVCDETRSARSPREIVRAVKNLAWR